MPLTLCVGLSRKVGQPDYGSLGASCEVQVEVDPSLLRQDPDGLQRQVQQAYDACRRAVQEELARHASPGTNGHANGQAANGRATNGGAANETASGNGRSNGSRGGRQATAAQVRAVHGLAARDRLDLPAELRRRFGVDRPEDLSLADASRLIDELKGTAANGSARR
jgi:hypothetical protein